MTENTAPAARPEPTNEDRKALLARLGITMTAEFVPWSQSRNSKRADIDGKPWLSLNWRVTLLKRNTGHGPSATPAPILTTEYGAGVGHCPAYKAPVSRLGHQHSVMRHEAIMREIETGRPASGLDGSKPFMPDVLDVVASLLMDSEAIDCGTFEEWASNLGYDTDSRKAEATYRACLEIGLKLRAALGDTALAELREAFQGY
jgi:hypothetical protein